MGPLLPQALSNCGWNSFALANGPVNGNRPLEANFYGHQSQLKSLRGKGWLFSIV